MRAYPTPTSVVRTVTASSATFSTTMAVGEVYLLCSSVACWIAQGAAPTAAKSDGSTHVGAGVPVLIIGTAGAKLAVLRDAADGNASLTLASVAA